MRPLTTIKDVVAMPAIKEASIAVVGNTLAAGVSGVALILISRSLGPIGFGLISVGFSLMQIAVRLADGGLTTVLIRYIPSATALGEKQQLFWFTSYLKIIFGLCIAVLGSFFATRIAAVLHVPAQLVHVVAWLNLVTLSFDHLGGLATAILQLRKAVMGNVVQAFVKFSLGLFSFFSTSLAATPIMAAYLLAPAPVLLLYRKILPAVYWQKPTHIPWRRFIFLTKAMAINNWLAGLSLALVQNVDVLLVSSLLPGDDVGYVGSAARITMFMSVAGYSLSGVLNPRVAGLKTETEVRTYWKQALGLMSLSLVGAVVLPFFGSLLMYITAGPAYMMGVEVLQWMLAAASLSVGIVGLSALFYRYHAPIYFSLSAIIQTVIIIGGIWWLLPQVGVIGVGWVRFSSQVSIVILTLCWAILAHKKTFATWPWRVASSTAHQD